MGWYEEEFSRWVLQQKDGSHHTFWVDKPGQMWTLRLGSFRTPCSSSDYERIVAFAKEVAAELWREKECTVSVDVLDGNGLLKKGVFSYPEKGGV